MLISRRNFFRISVLPALVSLAAPGISIFGQNDDEASDRLMSLRSSDFRNQIGSKFKLSDGGAPSRQAVLTEVKKFEASAANQSAGGDANDLKCFSLTFRLVGAGSVKQATYTVRHGILGNFQLFLVPSTVSSSQSSLIAVINRI